MCADKGRSAADKTVSWKLQSPSQNRKVTSPREMLKGFPYLGFISPHRPKMFYEEECKRTREVPAPWDYADGQTKAIYARTPHAV